jgi:integrase
MNPLRQALADYLSLRRSLGYALQRPEKLLNQFLDYVEERGASTITTDLAVAWAELPQDASPLWWGHRLTVVRGFAGYLHVLDEAHEVPPTDVLPWKSHRANPYLYTDTEIVAMIRSAATLRSPLRVATYQTLIALLAVTGMRVGEAIDLDVDDFDNDRGALLIRKSKGGATAAAVASEHDSSGVRISAAPGPKIDGPHHGAVDLPGRHQAALLQCPMDVSETVAAERYRSTIVVVPATHPRPQTQLRRFQAARRLHA